VCRKTKLAFDWNSNQIEFTNQTDTQEKDIQILQKENRPKELQPYNKFLDQTPILPPQPDFDWRLDFRDEPKIKSQKNCPLCLSELKALNVFIKNMKKKREVRKATLNTVSPILIVK
jgi:hypothetical protein